MFIVANDVPVVKVFALQLPWFVTPRSSSEQIAGSIVFYFRSSPNKEVQSFSSLLISCKVFFPKPTCTVDATWETPARHAQTQYLPLSCHVGVSCSIVVHSHEQVIVADVVKECCRFAVGLNLDLTVLLTSSLYGVKFTT